MPKNPELFGDEPVQTYFAKFSEEDKLLPTYAKKKPSKSSLRGYFRSLHRNRKRIMRRIVQFLLFVIVVYVLFSVYKLYLRARNPYCTTPFCQRAEKEIIESLDYSVHPCQNFYKFVCGNWQKHHELPSNSPYISVIQQGQQQMLNRIANFLRKPDSPDEPSIIHKVRKFYRSCLYTGRSDEERSFSSIAKVIADVGLPKIPSMMKKTKFSWIRTAALSKKLYDKNFFFEFDITMDPRNRSINKILITKPSTSTTFSSLFEVNENFFDLNNVDDMLKHADMNAFRQNPLYRFVRASFRAAYSETKKMWNNKMEKNFRANFVFLIFFTGSLDHIANSYINDGRHLPKLYSIKSLQKMTDKIFKRNKELAIDWKQYFKWMFKNTNVTLDFQNTDTKVLISHVEYLKDIFHLLSLTTTNTIESYMWWETVRGVLPYTNNRLNYYDHELTLKLTGFYKKPRTEFCSEITNNLYGFAVSYMILKDPLIKMNTDEVSEMIDNIQSQFHTTIQNLDWLDEKTKAQAIKKLDKMSRRVGYPKWLESNEELNKYYENVTCSASDFFGNIMNLRRLQMKWKLMYYRLRNDDTADGWYSKFVLQTNAFYVMEKNSMIIPVGLFAFPFYQHGLQALNYGALGMIIGHELTHGFDNTGKEFDQDGHQKSWWSKPTEHEFKTRSKCFVDEYNRYYNGITDLGYQTNGTLTMNENIADNGGLQLAYYAYKTYVEKYGPEKKLPKLKIFTPEQLFFISFAHTWCEQRSKSVQYAPEPHSPYAIRVLGSLKNFPAFADAWNCKIGSPMNPKRPKCQLW